MSNFQQLKDQGLIILYDSIQISKINANWFDLNYWQTQQAVLGGAPGRGTSLFIETPVGEAVWRHYHRGGLPGRLIKDSYVWHGLENTRAWQEFKLTAKLLAMGLPVPTPLAACVKKTGLVYSADLMTRRIPNAQPLHDLLLTNDQESLNTLLQQVGETVAAFHAVGLNHVDLNPRNILVSSTLNPSLTQVWLIDFDRCQLTQPKLALATSNINRLARALTKLDAQQSNAWLKSFMAGYTLT
ncbi:MAG TPA: 3-deoxy-D-manno-octulosonic acid kinase [Marinospirillum sp.]|uniref:3-deoxy-D-manno-octulosonic acid kinase n=1 Tax=Marinospirillum sp. TaxID=2183934 RepID=UPI002B486A8F|nr:3-deoxy-D-manno-octulosonic acid kinase [Marinospirillum sp.]HKM14608.1 3-deoxy-D-manno-octulosonic acid kinase [Marinospirillum sp.]